MSTITISALPSAGALTGAEILPIVQSGTTSQTTVQDIANLTVSASYATTASYAISSEGTIQGERLVFVQSNGTPLENGALLLQKYEEAKLLPTSQSGLTAFPFVYTADTYPYIDSGDVNNELFNAWMYNGYSPVNVNIDNQTYSFTYGGMFYDVPTFTPTLSDGSHILYIPATTYWNNSLVISPGYYSLTQSLNINQDRLNVISLTSQPDVVITGNNVNIDADYTTVRGLSVNSILSVAPGLTSLVVENCTGGSNSFGTTGSIAGTFINCIGGYPSFGSAGGLASGTFKNCVGYFGENRVADGTFIECNGTFGLYGTSSGTFTRCIGAGGGFGNIASGVFTDCTTDASFCVTGSGTFIRCKGGIQSFQLATGYFDSCTAGRESFGYYSPASGRFINCQSDESSFGYNSQASGYFLNCSGSYSCFGHGGTVSGQFINCVGGYQAFGGVSTGTFINCVGGAGSFGPYTTSGASNSGTFINCVGGNLSFGGQTNASGQFTNCVGGDGSFGRYGTLTGKLYYCRLTAGTFGTVSGGGRTIYCIDGNNNTNNQ